MSQTAAVARKPVDVDDVVQVVEAPSNLTIDLHPVVVNAKIVAQKQLEIARNWTGDTLAPKMQYQMAKLAVAYGLDPFLGELVCLGNKPYPTAAAIQRKANEDDRFDGEECRPATSDERTDFYFPFEPPADEHLWRCEVWMKGKSHSFIGWGRASVRNVKMSTMQMWLQEMAQKRARSRTYRLAINIGIPTIEEMYEFEDGTVMEVGPSKRIEATATVVDGAVKSGPPASKEQLEMINAHILTKENSAAEIISEDEWNGIVGSWDGMSAARAEKILQHFLGPKLDMKEGVLAERKSQIQ